MSDKMRMIPFGGLLERMMDEWRHSRSLFDIPENSFYRKSDNRIYQVFGQKISVPLGPAAGPQTQVTQNIIASYLTGSRFIELKTVQKMDDLEIPKPCIDMTDEGFNTEWSTELTLGQAWEEYAKAWILLHFLEKLFQLGVPELERSFVFNISVGYDLDGIKTPKMQRYLKRMKDSGSEERFQGWLTELTERIADPAFLEGTGLENRRKALKGLAADIPGAIVHNVSISTMHGTPPNEIESICRYMIDDQGLDTFVKLNPTLLGYEKVKGLLDNLGFTTVEMNPDSFSHDLQWEDARAMLGRLETFAGEKGRRFGVKLTNTLASINNRDELPGDEMYMSGRALYPITVTVAALVSEAFEGRIPISYSGGVSIHTAEGLLATGIRPLTLCSDMLKPGGYNRQKQIAEALESAPGWDLPSINVDAINALAEASATEKSAKKSFRGTDEVSHFGELPLNNCYVAPCVSACAIEQHIPEYIRLVGEKRYADALALIYERNALPSITGTICDHQCQIHCTRQDYEGPVNIREIKLMAVEKGMDEWRKRWSAPAKRPGPKVAVVGAGPAGLSAAFFLARAGVPVTVFEREPDAGGVVRYVVPHFRISREAIDSDIDVIKAMGAEFRFNQKDITVAGLKAEGFKKVILGIGTWNSPKLPVEGTNANIIPAAKFLYDFNRGAFPENIGETVVTVGAGDTSMDSARSALRIPGVKESKEMIEKASKVEEKEPFFKTIKEGMSSKNFRSVVAITVLNTTFNACLISSILYWVHYVLVLPDDSQGKTILTVVWFVTVIVAIPIWNRVIAKIGNKNTMIISLISSGLASFVVLFVTQITGAIISMVLLGATMSGTFISIMLMFADSVDEANLNSGKRKEGIFAGVFTFFDRIGYIIQTLIFTVVHIITNFDPKETITPLAKGGLIAAFTWIPAIGLFIAAFIAWKVYDLSPKKIIQIKKELKELGI